MPGSRSMSMQLERYAEDRLRAAGTAAFPGFALRRVARTPSTQDIVRDAVRRGAEEGFCCVAAEQTAGRGRQGRAWRTSSAGSSLLASVLLRPPPSAVAGVTIAAGLAVADALEATSRVGVQLKWPNDVMAEGGKLAGILAEVVTCAGDCPVVLGIGVNLSIDSFPPHISGTSLHRLCATPVPTWDVLLAAVLGALSARLHELTTHGLASLLPDWRTRAVGLGSTVDAMTPSGIVTGVAADIDDDGALLVTTAGRTVRLLAADVHIGTGPETPGADDDPHPGATVRGRTRT